MNWKDKAIELAQEGRSWRKIAQDLDVPRTTVSDFLRKTFQEIQLETERTETFTVRKEDVKEDNSRVLLISDMHIPYHHPDTLDFLTHLKKKYNPTRVICLGDELDKHALSYHDHDPDLPSAGDELRRSIPVIQEIHRLFPVMDIVESNH